GGGRRDEPGQEDPRGIAAREVRELVRAHGQPLVGAETGDGAHRKADLPAHETEGERDGQPFGRAPANARVEAEGGGHPRGSRRKLVGEERTAVAEEPAKPEGREREPRERGKGEQAPGGQDPRRA